jgi:capsular exopolysaccharide synthesis family protein
VARRFGQGSSVSLPATGADIEAFRSLRASLRYYSVGRSLNSLLITSPAPEDGKSTVARGLATTMAQMGDNVVLVETDLRKGDGRSGFSAGDPIGLSGVLVGDDLDTALHYVSVDGRDGEERQLAVLPSGPNPPNPSQLLESRRMAEVLEELTHRYDVVVLDSPPLTAVSDALALIHETSGVIVVGRLRHSTRDASLDLRKQLAMTNAPVLGVVANFAPVKTSGYYSGS